MGLVTVGSVFLISIWAMLVALTHGVGLPAAIPIGIFALVIGYVLLGILKGE